jgi:hypothetical protein
MTGHASRAGGPNRQWRGSKDIPPGNSGGSHRARAGSWVTVSPMSRRPPQGYQSSRQRDSRGLEKWDKSFRVVAQGDYVAEGLMGKLVNRFEMSIPAKPKSDSDRSRTPLRDVPAQ